jgi:hypothetical protein
MDQRQSDRLEVTIPAVVESKGKEFSNCQIRNYSKGGLFFQFERAYTSKESLAFFLKISNDDIIMVKTPHFSTRVRVVRITDNGLGTSYSLH